MKTILCPDCGKEIDYDSIYCSFCGRKIDGSSSPEGGKADSTRPPLNRKWIFISALIIVISEFLFAFIAGIIYTAFISSGNMTAETLVIVASIGSIAGIFSGSILAAYKSPGRTIKEPAIGAAIIILISKISDIIITGNFSLSGLAGMAAAYVIALAGAFLGEKIQERKQPHS